MEPHTNRDGYEHLFWTKDQNLLTMLFLDGLKIIEIKKVVEKTQLMLFSLIWKHS